MHTKACWAHLFERYRVRRQGGDSMIQVTDAAKDHLREAVGETVGQFIRLYVLPG